MKLGLYAAGLALVAVTLVGCDSDGGNESGTDAAGGDSSGAGAPDSASQTDFCDNFLSLTTDMGEVGDSDDPSALIAKVKDAAAAMEETGTPEGIPDDARAGFEVFVDTIAGVDEDASLAELQAVGNDLDAEDQANFTAFSTYLSSTCAPTTAPSPSPSPSPS